MHRYSLWYIEAIACLKMVIYCSVQCIEHFCRERSPTLLQDGQEVGDGEPALEIFTG